MASLRDIIREITRKHLEENNSMIMGQCLSAVGWVNGTVPDTQGVVELPMTDVAGADIACGVAITGRRPILVLRFQDFLLLNGNALAIFAAKRKEIFQKSCPLFVRALAKEGNGTGNSHSGKLHSTFMHFPGLRIWAPITPNEYQACWDDFMQHDDPTICFEHRSTFDNEEEFKNLITPNADITVFAISLARINAKEAVGQLWKEGVICNLIAIPQLKPFTLSNESIDCLEQSGRGLVVDTGYETCGAARDIAYQYSVANNVIVEAMGLKEVSAGVARGKENLTPSAEEIMVKVKSML